MKITFKKSYVDPGKFFLEISNIDIFNAVYLSPEDVVILAKLLKEMGF